MNFSVIPFWVKALGVVLVVAAIFGAGYKKGHDDQQAVIDEKTEKIGELNSKVETLETSGKAKDDAIVRINKDNDDLKTAVSRQNFTIEQLKDAAKLQKEKADAAVKAAEMKYARIDKQLAELVSIKSRPVDPEYLKTDDARLELQDCRRAVEINNAAEEMWK